MSSVKEAYAGSIVIPAASRLSNAYKSQGESEWITGVTYLGGLLTLSSSVRGTTRLAREVSHHRRITW